MNIRTKLALATAVTAALALAAPLAASAQPAPEGPVPTPVPLIQSTDAVPGRYIVTLDKGVDAAELAAKLKLKPSFVYRSALNGFAVPLTPLQLDIVRVSLGVKVVEEDATVSALPTPASRSGLRGPSSTWGLDRIDQKALPLDNGFTTQGNGAGVTAYILDTGIDYKHAEFGGRATFGFDAMGDGKAGLDCNGHGTHVAGTVAGATYGVARKAKLVSVRVLGCDGKGTWSGIIAGMDWVAKSAKQPAVMNASLGGDRSDAVNNAATAVSDAGILPVVAAGNSSVDACNISPASALRVLTVGATNRWDEETSFSNYGPCVSVYAPGQAIVSAKLGGGSIALDGTSMASPHVAGVAALYKAAHPTAGPAEINEFIDDESSKDLLNSISNTSPNKLLFTGGL